jgi:CheY-like chemotaxis protein
VFEAGRVLVTSLSQQALVAAARMAVAGPSADLPAASTTSLPLSAPAPMSPRLAVLVVDDQPINRLVLQQQLQQLGCRVEPVADGAAALARVAERRYAMILTDINMPGMNGYELAEQCRALGHTTPIIAVTAAALPGERERCLRAGMNDYLLKPFSLAALAGLLERHAHVTPIASNATATAATPDEVSSVTEVIAVTSAETIALSNLRKTLQKWNRAMTDTVLQSLAKDRTDLRLALAAAEAGRLEGVAHRVEGGMAALEIRPAMALCRALRDCIACEWPDQAFGMAPLLDTMLKQIMADVRATQRDALASAAEPGEHRPRQPHRPRKS